ncbi:MAG: ABC transporter permease [Bacteroidia bacterium]|nr:ABC transporter permease [Bacteroidia bacterium]
MNPIIHIFFREIRTRLRDWRFWISVLSMPLIILVIGVIVALVQRSRAPIHIYITDQAQNLSIPPKAGFAFTPAPPLPIDSLKSRLQKGEGLLLYKPPADSTAVPTLEIYMREALSAPELERLEELLRTVILQRELLSCGLPSEKAELLLSAPLVKTFILTESEKTPKSAEIMTLLSTALSFFLFFIILNAGSQILLSILEEKTNRLAEYLLIYVSPMQLLTGKLLASLCLTLVQGGVWIGFVIGVGKFVLSSTAVGAGALYSLPWMWIGGFLIGGVLLYTFLYAAAGASSESVTELSSFAQSLYWPLLISFILVSAASLQSNDKLTIFLSHFPLTSPLAMPLRLAGGTVSLAEKLISMALLWVSVVGAQLFAARLYKRALLLYGQKLSWKGIWRLLSQ